MFVNNILYLWVSSFVLSVCFAVRCAIYCLFLFLGVIYLLPVICVRDIFLCHGILSMMVQPQGEIGMWRTSTSPSHSSLDQKKFFFNLVKMEAMGNI